MLNDLKLSHITAGFVAVLVGYTSSVSIIFQAAESAGANLAQINSWLLVLGVGMGLTTLSLSLFYKVPYLTAWSTPGAALLVTGLYGVSISEATGAFIVCGLLILLSGLTGWFEKISQIIPKPISAAMLAGVLFKFGSEIFFSLESDLILVSVMGLSYLIGKVFMPRYTIPLVLLVGILLSSYLGLFITAGITFQLANPVFVSPTFTFSTLLSVALPLFVVTMSSQNLPGIATLHASGYNPPISPAISVTGFASVLLAPFGGFAFNLAAITAAICQGSEADENKQTRYLAAVSAGIFYILLGLLGATVVALFAASPKPLVLAIAGFALLGTIGNSLSMALKEESNREAAIVTFLMTASGISLFQIGSAFWGLVVGILFYHVLKPR
ncbi:MAG: benzoate/H(+) symporter BenE family transporter [Gammaproteobacteria bacterium]|nr:benzoate/H(+) symporter BenE family transporter [Gammaproteobacteria bacterium]